MLIDGNHTVQAIQTKFSNGYDDAFKRGCDRSSLNATDILDALYMQGWYSGEDDFTAWEQGYDAALGGSQAVCPYVGGHDRTVFSWVDGWQYGVESDLLTLGEC